VFQTAQSRAVAALVGASFLFGATFVVVKSALDDISPLSFVAWRFLIGAIILFALALPRGREIWVHGTIAGVALFAGYALQTAGLQYTSASNSALITGLYVVLTPFLAAIFARRAPSPLVVLGAVIAFIGVYLLTGVDSLSLGLGDLLTVGCALAFAFHIVALARFAHRHPVVPFTAVQILVTTLLAFPASWIVDGSATVPPRSTWVALAITGVGVTAGAFLLQIWAQRVVGAATAAVVLAAEPAFGVATGWVVLDERLTVAGWIGAALIVVAIFVVITNQRDPASREAEGLTVAH
jgi:drug/metabolite transporter (DMT)-like permease